MSTLPFTTGRGGSSAGNGGFEMRQVRVEDLRPGDLIYVAWSDAWEADRVPLKEREYDVVWHEWGCFLFVRGQLRRHLVMAYNKKPGDVTKWNFTAIPVDLILRVVLVQRSFLQRILPGLVERLLKRADLSAPKRFAFNSYEVVRWSAEIP